MNAWAEIETRDISTLSKKIENIIHNKIEGFEQENLEFVFTPAQAMYLLDYLNRNVFFNNVNEYMIIDWFKRALYKDLDDLGKRMEKGNDGKDTNEIDA
jgi:hypothetical protein